MFPCGSPGSASFSVEKRLRKNDTCAAFEWIDSFVFDGKLNGNAVPSEKSGGSFEDYVPVVGSVFPEPENAGRIRLQNWHFPVMGMPSAEIEAGRACAKENGIEELLNRSIFSSPAAKNRRLHLLLPVCPAPDFGWMNPQVIWITAPWKADSEKEGGGNHHCD